MTVAELLEVLGKCSLSAQVVINQEDDSQFYELRLTQPGHTVCVLTKGREVGEDGYR